MTQLVLERASLTVKLRDVLRTVSLYAEIAQPPAHNPPLVVTQAIPYPELPYVIVYPIEGGTFLGPPLYAPESFGTLIYQFSCVGQDGFQCEKVADKVRRTLLGRTSTGYVTSLNTSDLKVTYRESYGPGTPDGVGIPLMLPERYSFGVDLI